MKKSKENLSSSSPNTVSKVETEIHFVVDFVEGTNFNLYDSEIRERCDAKFRRYWEKACHGLFQYCFVYRFVVDGIPDKWTDSDETNPVNLFDILLDDCYDDFLGHPRAYDPKYGPELGKFNIKDGFSVCLDNRFILCSTLASSLIDSERSYGTSSSAVCRCIKTSDDVGKPLDEDGEPLDERDAYYRISDNVDHDYLYWFDEVKNDNYVCEIEDLCEKPKYIPYRIKSIFFDWFNGIIKFICNKNKKIVINMKKDEFESIYANFSKNGDGAVVCALSFNRIYKELKLEYWNGKATDEDKFIMSTGDKLKL